ncbi:hypothetical protein KUTeg_004442 [Tegillarca granosa]|uniref:Voltage-dependent calcium channel gamma-5 subunit n=1 Tax=Tegillarca granosa TaxID=220873 RepID=A0ABQ9FRI2_TEGGR|nr:hypothetical protein KUTeg_004442 [Tegillarca granosa]
MVVQVNCLPVKYFEPDAERVEEQETSMAIIRANRVAVLFPVIALLLLIVGSILSVLGNIRQDCKTLIAAVIYILSGLSVAVGIILYISAINDEVGHRLSKKSDDKDSTFSYSYGWSFYFAGLSFLFSMLTAVTLVSLYLQRNSKTEDMIKIIPGLEDLLEVETSNETGVDNRERPPKATIII